MIVLLLFLVLVALVAICWNLRQIGESLILIAASLHVDAMKKAGIVDEVRAAILRRSEPT